jgi:hypothetical protein
MELVAIKSPGFIVVCADFIVAEIDDESHGWLFGFSQPPERTGDGGQMALDAVESTAAACSSVSPVKLLMNVREPSALTIRSVHPNSFSGGTRRVYGADTKLLGNHPRWPRQIPSHQPVSSVWSMTTELPACKCNLPRFST